MIRSIQASDYNELKKIHEKYYAQEFEFPDFVTNFLGAFVVEDDKGIITAGGIRTIAELIAITDKSRTPEERRNALFDILGVTTFVAERSKYDQVHAFIQDEKWMNRLYRVGFHQTVGKSLVLDI